MQGNNNSQNWTCDKCNKKIPLNSKFLHRNQCNGFIVQPNNLISTHSQSQVECPFCNNSFPQTEIETHIDENHQENNSLLYSDDEDINMHRVQSNEAHFSNTMPNQPDPFRNFNQIFSNIFPFNQPRISHMNSMQNVSNFNINNLNIGGGISSNLSSNIVNGQIIIIGVIRRNAIMNGMQVVIEVRVDDSLVEERIYDASNGSILYSQSNTNRHIEDPQIRNFMMQHANGINTGSNIQIMGNLNNMQSLNIFNMSDIINPQPQGLSQDEIEVFKCKLNNVDKLNSSNKNCVICMESFAANEEIITLPCLHIFHYTCGSEWLQGNKTCPICKHSISFEDE